MVVNEVQDLDLAAIGQMPLGGVRLPAFVGQAGPEADEGGARPLVRLRGDQAATTEDSPDGGARRRCRRQTPGEVVGDGLGPGVVTRSAELLAELEDGGDDLLADLPWTPSRSARVRLERRLAVGSNSGDQLVQPAPGDAMGLGDFGRAAFLDEHRVDHIALQSHPGTSLQ